MNTKFCGQASVASQRQFNSLNYILNHYWQRVTKKTKIAAIALLLGLSGGSWATTEIIAPQIAQAKTASLELSIVRQPNEPYESFVDRAEVAAREAVQASFEQEKQATDVSVIVMGHNQGAITPVMSVDVSRSEWQRNPNIKSWSKYFFSARSLLRFDPDLADTNSSQSNTSTFNRSRRSQSSPSNSSTPGRSQSSPSNSSTPGRSQSPPIPGSVRGENNNPFSQPGNSSSPTTSGGQPTNSNSGQSGNSISPTSPNSNSSSGGGITNPEQLTPSTIEPPTDNLQNPNSSNGSSSGGVIPSTSTPADNFQNLNSPNNGSSSGGVTPSTSTPVPSGIRGTTTNLEERNN